MGSPASAPAYDAESHSASSRDTAPPDTVDDVLLDRDLLLDRCGTGGFCVLLCFCPGGRPAPPKAPSCHRASASGPGASNPGIVNHIQEVEVLHLQLLLICALIHKLCLSGKDGWQCLPGTWSANRSGKGEKVRARTGVFFSPRTARIRCILQGRLIPPAGFSHQCQCQRPRFSGHGARTTTIISEDGSRISIFCTPPATQGPYFLPASSSLPREPMLYHVIIVPPGRRRRPHESVVC